MNLEQFAANPWRASHDAYQSSAFAMTPAPEYASAEVLLASLYRVIGFADLQESKIPAGGRALEKLMAKQHGSDTGPNGADLAARDLHTLLHGILESPKAPNQSSKRFIQVTPLVPEVARFSGSARPSANSWTAGALVRRMVWLGSSSPAEASALWARLFGALTVGPTDDVFARWLQGELQDWTGSTSWALVEPGAADVASLDQSDFEGAPIPARQFVEDLDAIIGARDVMTRRQWTSLLEAVIRLGAVAHVIWLCDVQSRMWQAVRSAFVDGIGPSDEAEARDQLLPQELRYLSYGDKALDRIKDRTSNYLRARLGLNAVLWALADAGQPFIGTLSTSADLARLCELVRGSRDKLIAAGLATALDDVEESEAQTIRCKKGTGSNVFEFSRHVLGQRQAAVDVLRGYDQGYVLRKKTTARASPWVVALGPVAVLAMVHCSLAETRGPASVRRLSQHLSRYGIVVERSAIANNDLGQQLRMLGLVLDSPDAESGMLMVPPFPPLTATRSDDA